MFNFNNKFILFGGNHSLNFNLSTVQYSEHASQKVEKIGRFYPFFTSIILPPLIHQIMLEMSESKALLKRFVPKGGTIGRIAEMYVHDQEKSAKFLLELKHQAKTNRLRMEAIWGKNLISDLEKFS